VPDPAGDCGRMPDDLDRNAPVADVAGSGRERDGGECEEPAVVPVVVVGAADRRPIRRGRAAQVRGRRLGDRGLVEIVHRRVVVDLHAGSGEAQVRGAAETSAPSSASAIFSRAPYIDFVLPVPGGAVLLIWLIACQRPPTLSRRRCAWTSPDAAGRGRVCGLRPCGPLAVWGAG
jgi:hypothetical protein